MNAVLVLEDGTIIEGTGFGAGKEVYGELVFSTTMSGYQEGLTDPSYKGQILMPTYPMIGNYGINPGDYESDRIKVEGFAVRENCHVPSHRKSEMTIDDFLKKEDIPGISGIDTRAITLKLRNYGVMKAALATSSEDIDISGVINRLKKQPDISERDLVKEVTLKEKNHFPGKGKKVGVVDCGMKKSILENLLKRGCNVTVFPADTKADEIMDDKPDGVLISPGPGDPQNAPYTIETLKNLMGNVPIFGICLGHQMLSLASGAETFKLKFGHRGANQPVKDLRNNRVYITSQNHGYAVDGDSLKKTDFELTHINLNDNTVEGMKHKKLKIMSVQYHPEAHPGPTDSEYLFDEFLGML